MKNINHFFGKICLSIVCLALSVSACVLGIGVCVSNSLALAADDTSMQLAAATSSALLDGVSISQDGYVFSMNDFEKTTTDSIATYTLYTNTTITISYDGSKNYNVRVDQYINKELKKSQILSNNNNRIAFVLDEQNCLTSTILLTYTNPVTDAAASNLASNRFEFVLVQTPVQFSYPTFEWIYSENNNEQVIAAPTDIKAYTNQISLRGLVGSADCPTYVDFYHNGNYFCIYTDNSDGIFYNNFTGNKLTSVGELAFSIAGQYSITIYDKTSITSSPWANSVQYSFVIQKDQQTSAAQNVYVVATDTSGQTMANGQTVNDVVQVNFYNLSDKSVVNSIVVERAQDVISGGHNIYETELFDSYNWAQDIEANTFLFSEDGKYNIYVKYDPRKINPSSTTEATIIYSISFNISTEIKRSYNSLEVSLDSADTTLVPYANTIYSINCTETLNSEYSAFEEVDSLSGDTKTLTNSYTNTYVVLLARNHVSIDGIEDSGSSSDTVNLVVHGVGDITVSVSRNGNTTTYTLKDGNTIPTDATSEVGSYTIHIQDQMGSYTTKSFKITRSLNGATIALIVIGIVALVLFAFVIIKWRTRLQVR
jgi:hypothetical protein